MKILRIFIVIIFLSMLGWGLYDLIVQKNYLERETSGLKAKVDVLAEENKILQENIEYFKNPENLLKELKSQFNYREADEKLIIIVPPSENSATTTR